MTVESMENFGIHIITNIEKVPVKCTLNVLKFVHKMAQKN